MKLIVSTAVALVLAGQAFAGNLVFEAPEEPVVVAEPAPMGGSNAAWIIPVIGLAAIAYAISNDDDDDDDDTTDDDDDDGVVRLIFPPRGRGSAAALSAIRLGATSHDVAPSPFVRLPAAFPRRSLNDRQAPSAPPWP